MKNEIRRRVLAEREKMSAEEVREKSIKIQERLFGSSYYQSSRTIMTYIDFHNEVETRDIVRKAIEDDKVIVVPLCGSGSTLLPVRIESLDDLEPGTKGILEPTETRNIVDVKKLDLVLMPGITFDRSGNRVGYGLAYYDRFLEQLSPSTLIVALAYSFQVIDSVPFEEHDQKIHFIITEDEIIRCGD